MTLCPHSSILRYIVAGFVGNVHFNEEEEEEEEKKKETGGKIPKDQSPSFFPFFIGCLLTCLVDSNTILTNVLIPPVTSN